MQGGLSLTEYGRGDEWRYGRDYGPEPWRSEGRWENRVGDPFEGRYDYGRPAAAPYGRTYEPGGYGGYGYATSAAPPVGPYGGAGSYAGPRDDREDWRRYGYRDFGPATYEARRDPRWGYGPERPEPREYAPRYGYEPRPYEDRFSRPPERAEFEVAGRRYGPY